MIDKQDDTIDEGLRRNQKYNLYQRFEHLESELAEIKSALRERGIILIRNVYIQWPTPISVPHQ